MPTYFIGVDVGTGSARAALVTENGKILKVATETIQTWNPQIDFYEQSSEDIWNACVSCVKKITENIDVGDVKGVGFDATCSLVALDTNWDPLTVSTTGRNEQNVILWMDHRASQEANHINKIGNEILKYLGGKISLEMEVPKLLWLKNNLPQWSKYGAFFDLPDFLTWKATGNKTRSLCSLICKWNYDVSQWNDKYFEEIGLEDIRNYDIGTEVVPPGTKIGGLSSFAAKQMGLVSGTAVGTSIIDAHAGGLGLVGCQANGINPDFSTRLSLICGTSTCHMVVSKQPIFVQGIWGPYFSAMVPGMYLNEGGQSATGKLIDHIIDSHPVTNLIKTKIGTMHIQTYLSDLLKNLAKENGLDFVDFLTKDIHIWPDFHGNRSPIADASLKGTITGLSLSENEEDLALLYLATIQGLAYGTRHIFHCLQQAGHQIQSILICGGLSKNPLFTQTQANVINLPVVCPKEMESVLLGSAILGASASGFFPNVTTAITSMAGTGTVITPIKNVWEYHQKKYKVFLKLYQHQMEYRNIMN